MTPSPPRGNPARPSGVREAHARLAAIQRWRPDDADALRAARWDLVLAQATALEARAAEMRRGE